MIRFLLNQNKISTEAAPGLLVLDFLRRHQHLQGTKEGCKEGDCGACVVLLGELRSGQMKYLPMTSCLMPLGELQGKHLVTIEGLDLGGGKLNPVQQAIVDQGGSQCGFCTPGIVVSLTALLFEAAGESREKDVAKGLSGHLCRCTGYRSLEDAGADALAAVARRGVSALVAEGVLPEYFAAIPQRLASLEAAAQEAAPGSEEVILGGGTDLYVQQGEDLPAKRVFLVPRSAAPPVIREGSRHGGIGGAGGVLRIAAAATFQQLAENEELRQTLPHLPQWMDEIASWQIRNRATLGGNLVNASPIGDLSILFLAWKARLWLRLAGKERQMPMRDFYLAYKKTALLPGEVLREVRVAAPPGLMVGWEKVAKRRSLDIATVNLAFLCEQDGEGKLRNVGLAAGGVAPIPLALERCEALLEGQQPSLDLVARVLEVAQEEIAPISDVRGSADYKRLLVRQLLIAQLTRHFPKALAVEDFYPQEVGHGGA